MSKYELMYDGLSDPTNQIVVYTLVRMRGEDVHRNLDNDYTQWLVFVIADAEGDMGKDMHSVCIYPVADDLSSEYDVPYVQWEQEDDMEFSEVLKIYERYVHIALHGMVEVNL